MTKELYTLVRELADVGRLLEDEDISLDDRLVLSSYQDRLADYIDENMDRTFADRVWFRFKQTVVGFWDHFMKPPPDDTALFDAIDAANKALVEKQSASPGAEVINLARYRRYGRL